MLGLSVPLLSACNDRPAPRSLKDDASLFRINQNIPDSTFAIAGVGASTDGNMPQSSFAEQGGEQSVLRLNEVPSELREKTAELLTTLNARQSSDNSIIIDLPADVLFDFDKATLRPDAVASLNRAAALLASYPDAPIVINGHTDSKGSDAYNDPLSLRRAQAVADWLHDKAGRQPVPEGFGSRKPVAPNSNPDGSDSPDGRQRNRRVEIVIKPAAG